MPSLKELSKREEGVSGGHRTCIGCAAPIAARQILLSAEEPVVIGLATGCLEVTTTIYPYTAWKIPYIHSAFENAAATVSGVEAAYRALKKQGKLDKELRFIAMGGDGGTYDIGFQSLSGAMERGHRMLYICYNNEAYMNTGIQRSSATPMGANTTTSPNGRKSPGKSQFRKDLTEIMVAHDIPYVAQSSPSYWQDLTGKVERALDTDGPSFMNVLSPCQLGWGFPAEDTVEIGKLAVETCIWPLYEVIHGEYKLSHKPAQKKPVIEYLQRQVRFRHLLRPENAEVVEALQAEVDRKWTLLLKRCGIGE